MFLKDSELITTGTDDGDGDVRACDGDPIVLTNHQF